MNEDEEILERYTLGDDEPPSQGVYSGVATLEDSSPLDLAPLAEAVDPDALDALLAGETRQIRVILQYCGYEIAVTADEVRVKESGDE